MAIVVGAEAVILRTELDPRDISKADDRAILTGLQSDLPELFGRLES